MGTTGSGKPTAELWATPQSLLRAPMGEGEDVETPNKINVTRDLAEKAWTHRRRGDKFVHL